MPSRLSPLPPLEILNQHFTLNKEKDTLFFNERPYSDFEHLTYPERAFLRWDEGKAGRPVKTHESAKRRPYIHFQGKQYYVHRIIKKMLTGKEPGIIRQTKTTKTNRKRQDRQKRQK